MVSLGPVWILLLHCLALAFSGEPKTTESTLNVADETWNNAEKLILQVMKTFSRSMLPLMVKINSEVRLSSDCMGSLFRLFLDLGQFKGWAVKMADAVGKPAAGILEGTVAFLGSYDECLGIEVKRRDRKPIRGQYCLLEIWPPLPPKPSSSFMRKFVSQVHWDMLPSDRLFDMARNFSFLFHLAKFQYGVCLPSTCTFDEVKQITLAVVKEMKFKGSLRRCEVRTALEVTPDQLIVLCSLVCIFILATIGTVLDLYFVRFKRKEDYFFKYGNNDVPPRAKMLEVLLAFSVTRNTIKLLKPDATYQELSSLHGFRFLTVTGIMTAATYGYFDPTFYKKLGDLFDSTRTVSFQILLGGQVAINSLFFLSGLMTMYFTTKSLQASKRGICVHVFIIHRIIRLTPPILLVLGLMMLVPLISSGPVWQDMVGRYVDVCRATWWTNIVYVSNWLPYSQLCLMSMWFLATDMQLHLLSLLILIPFFRNRKLGLAIGIFLEVCRSITVATITIIYNVEAPISSPDIDVWVKMLEKIYLKPHSLNGCFCVGLIAGYFIAEHPTFVIRLRYRIVGWCLTIACSLSMLCLPHHLGKMEERDAVGTVLYTTFHQTVWSAAMAWIAVTCAIGYGGIIQKILSFKLIVPLSRLSFTAFLLHEIVIRTRYSMIRQTFVFSHYNLFYEFCSHFLVCFSLAYACHVIVEVPFAKIERLLFPNWDYATKMPTKESLCFPSQKKLQIATTIKDMKEMRI